MIEQDGADICILNAASNYIHDFQNHILLIGDPYICARYLCKRENIKTKPKDLQSCYSIIAQTIFIFSDARNTLSNMNTETDNILPVIRTWFDFLFVRIVKKELPDTKQEEQSRKLIFFLYKLFNISYFKTSFHQFERKIMPLLSDPSRNPLLRSR